MQQPGTTFNISNELLREAICAIYGHKQQHNVSELRYYLFGSLTADPSRLPHVKMLHINILCVLTIKLQYGAGVYLTPHGHGRRVKVNSISIDSIES